MDKITASIDNLKLLEALCLPDSVMVVNIGKTISIKQERTKRNKKGTYINGRTFLKGKFCIEIENNK